MRSGDASLRTLPLSHRRAFVARHTRLRDVDGVPGIRLHLADDVETLWPDTEAVLGIDGAPIPFWAFAWAGGLALARFVAEHPYEVAGRQVLDIGSGSGLVAIAAARAGAGAVTAVDVDPFAEAALALNARANRVRLRVVMRDLLDEPPPDVDVLLCGDAWYESPLAQRMTPWLRAAAGRGIRVLAGDPGRRYLPANGLVELARYRVRTTTVLEDRDEVEARAFSVTAVAPGSGAATAATMPR